MPYFFPDWNKSVGVLRMEYIFCFNVSIRAICLNAIKVAIVRKSKQLPNLQELLIATLAVLAITQTYLFWSFSVAENAFSNCFDFLPLSCSCFKHHITFLKLANWQKKSPNSCIAWKIRDLESYSIDFWPLQFPEKKNTLILALMKYLRSWLVRILQYRISTPSIS